MKLATDDAIWFATRPLLALTALILALLPMGAQAIPAFNRQTGQNCVACHAGGQFPELTPYGRLFKMTGYTIGERALPISAMAVVSLSKVADTAKSDDPSGDFQKNNRAILATASLLLGGKVTDNIGAFAQITYDPYATQDANGNFHGHSNADNIDIRYADRFISGQRDLIVGLSANNKPSVSDPWNTAAAWMQYVPCPPPRAAGSSTAGRRTRALVRAATSPGSRPTPTGTRWSTLSSAATAPRAASPRS